MNVTKPQDFHPGYAEAVNSADVDAVSSLYRVRRAAGAAWANRGRLRSSPVAAPIVQPKIRRTSMISETKTIQGRTTALWLFAVVGTVLLSLNASHAQTLVRDLDNPARQPFQAELQRLRIPSSGGGESFQVADVPLGKRLVIEHVSFRVGSLEASLPGSPSLRFGTFASLVTKVNGVPGSHELIVNRIDLSGGRIVTAASQPIRAYADPGSQVFVRIGSRTEDNSDSLEGVHLTVSGHFVDVP